MVRKVIVKLFLLLSVLSLVQAGKIPEDACDSPSCIKAAEEIQSKLDTSIEPCQDFYSFACGQFVKNTNIPEDKVIVDSFSIVGDALKEQLKTVITSPIEENDIEPFKIVKRLYSACMNKGKANIKLP